MTAEERAYEICRNFFDVRFFEGAIEEAIKEAIEQEREDCAKMADIMRDHYGNVVAQAIRARRGEK